MVVVKYKETTALQRRDLHPAPLAEPETCRIADQNPTAKHREKSASARRANGPFSGAKDVLRTGTSRSIVRNAAAIP
jgi:hypothetical protein